MINDIYIRADGGGKIGLGHLVRCISLANMVKSAFKITFFCKEIVADIKIRITEQGFSLMQIEQEEEFFDKLTGDEIVILDHYELNEDFQQRVKFAGSILVYIDDLHQKEIFADLVINQAPQVQTSDYNCRAVSQFALGLEYALLRPSFLEKAKQPKTNPRNNSVLICFGGSDEKNLTLIALKEVLKIKTFQKINVVAGSAYLHGDEIKALVNDYPEINYQQAIDEDEILKLIEDSEIAIVPCSGILLEALAAGNTVISGWYVENQRNFFHGYHQLGAFINAGDFSPEKILNALNLAKAQKETPKRLIDGLSGDRILKIFNNISKQKELKLRQAQASDVDVTFNWATDKIVREFSFNKEEIGYHEHCKWFLSKIDEDTCYYYIGDFQGKTLGTIRFEVKDGLAIISYLVDPKFHGGGLGLILLKKGIEALLLENDRVVKTIVGYVMPQNVASSKAFRNLGFTQEITEGMYRYSKNINYAN
ncbi:MAG: UDP-2,4-diacetamido-2,4,6-trideoxy-beta-L-altropyranose hydrolase [Flavobacterium sp.]|nr:MAG: UDP-2,4-diacetamido-2,4,6-trideoxy-beta-L-altropyranose hydrolase [Flavobacterium sp.]